VKVNRMAMAAQHVDMYFYGAVWRASKMMGYCRPIAHTQYEDRAG